MTLDSCDLMSRYLDESLTDEEFHQLQVVLRTSPSERQRFAQLSFLHNRLQSEVAVKTLKADLRETNTAIETKNSGNIHRMTIPLIVAAITLVLLAWFGSGSISETAGAELKRLIEAQSKGTDTTYKIEVEEVNKQRQPNSRATTDHRPPKPPLNNALLHVRKGNMFVLIRQTPEGQPFITGSNGQESWAVRPDGPVRFSKDLGRFNRDLPGHEHNIPLTHLELGLAQLHSAYDVQLLPVEYHEETAEEGAPTRLLVAVKKRGYRGPQRVEITYVVSTGKILQLRFVEMPYGPERLTIRLSLIEERNLETDYFNHATHHSPELIVEEE